MSCIAGVGGNVKALVKTAKSERPIVVIDGCPLACAKACLNNHGIQPDMHVKLSDSGVKKRQDHDFDKAEADEIYVQLSKDVNKLHGS